MSDVHLGVEYVEPADGAPAATNFPILLGSLTVGVVGYTTDADGRTWLHGGIYEDRWRGRGYGPAAFRLLIEHLRRAGVPRVFGRIRPGNLASLKAAERIGMFEVARTDHDVFVSLSLV